MELSPPYSEESPPESSVAAACCDFTTCCYSGLCAVLCFTGVAITFIFSSVPDTSNLPDAAASAASSPQTWLLGPVLILLSVLVAVKTLMHVRKQRLRLAGRRGRQRRRRRRRGRDSFDQADVEGSLELSLPPRGHDLPPSYEEVMKLMQEERRAAPPPPPPEPAAEVAD